MNEVFQRSHHSYTNIISFGVLYVRLIRLFSLQTYKLEYTYIPKTDRRSYTEQKHGDDCIPCLQIFIYFNEWNRKNDCRTSRTYYGLCMNTNFEYFNFKL